jgi:hypothetical protein
MLSSEEIADGARTVAVRSMLEIGLGLPRTADLGEPGAEGVD